MVSPSAHQAKKTSHHKYFFRVCSRVLPPPHILRNCTLRGIQYKSHMMKKIAPLFPVHSFWSIGYFTRSNSLFKDRLYINREEHLISNHKWKSRQTMLRRTPYNLNLTFLSPILSKKGKTMAEEEQQFRLVSAGHEMIVMLRCSSEKKEFYCGPGIG